MQSCLFILRLTHGSLGWKPLTKKEQTQRLSNQAGISFEQEKIWNEWVSTNQTRLWGTRSKRKNAKTKFEKNNLKYLLCRDFQFSFLFVDNIFVHRFLLACFSTNLDIDSIAYPLIAPLNVSIVQFAWSLYIVLLFFSTVLFTERFHSRDQQLCKFIKQKETFTEEKSSTPTGFVWYTNMAAVLLFWSTNMAAVTSCENALFISSFASVVCS